MADNFSGLPDKLRIVDGELVCADGSDVREYLRAFALRAKATADTPIVIMRRDHHERDRLDAIMMRGWGA
jgi:hypothetical protein